MENGDTLLRIRIEKLSTILIIVNIRFYKAYSS